MWTNFIGLDHAMGNVSLRHCQHPNFGYWSGYRSIRLCPKEMQQGVLLIIRNSKARWLLTQCAWNCSWDISRPELVAGDGKVRGSLGMTGWTPAGPSGPAGTHSTWTRLPGRVQRDEHEVSDFKTDYINIHAKVNTMKVWPETKTYCADLWGQAKVVKEFLSSWKYLQNHF